MNERDKELNPIQAISFLRSVIASGETLSEADNRQLDATIAGYDAALKSGQWVKVEDRLPEEKGFYLTREPDRNSGDRYGVHMFMPNDLICIAGWRQTYQSWMPIPEYQEEKEKVEPLTKERLDKMTPAEIAELDWKEVREVLSQ